MDDIVKGYQLEFENIILILGVLIGVMVGALG